jgi:hypothetical protein
MTRFKVHLQDGTLVYLEAPARNGRELLQEEGPFKVDEVHYTNGDKQENVTLWVPKSAIATVEVVG